MADHQLIGATRKQPSDNEDDEVEASEAPGQVMVLRYRVQESSRVGGLDVFRRFCSLKTSRTPTHCSRTP
ncbi:hypothetical protein EYF80_055853 [Liparis tanakae]|uniref:Uncharacterized protein n=1 Tax=Liparis tanakae TaxID=230148 RepID=A0A4Z2EYE4_9TELE|nr:hypothetical protein EYF80_055853 [Liparis tanakae]